MDDGMIDTGNTCLDWHPIWLVSEGYGLCFNEDWCINDLAWFAWRMTEPRVWFRESDLHAQWQASFIRPRESGAWIEAWVSRNAFSNKDDALAFIQADIHAHRALPFDEEAERARLMPV